MIACGRGYRSKLPRVGVDGIGMPSAAHLAEQQVRNMDQYVVGRGLVSWNATMHPDGCGVGYASKRETCTSRLRQQQQAVAGSRE